MTITEFLYARLEEDEETALNAAGWDRSGRRRASGRWVRSGISSVEDEEHRPVIYDDNGHFSGSAADHIARHDPARALADAEGKAAIVGLHRVDDTGMDEECGELERNGPCLTMKFLAALYSDHPDYQTEWNPS